MTCNHLLIDELIPNWDVEYLFIGTFNPKIEGNNANYFYGRSNNDFWYILPQVFNKESLIDRKYREDKDYLKSFLKTNKIGLTDLISKIANVDENNSDHQKFILSYKDKDLERYELVFNTEHIIKLIDKNNLKGVYFTRQIDLHLKNICQHWMEVKNHCIAKSIDAFELVSPSRGYRSNGYNRDKKLQVWRNVILN